MINIIDDKKNYPIPETLNNNSIEKTPITEKGKPPVTNFCYINGDPDGDGLD